MMNNEEVIELAKKADLWIEKVSCWMALGGEKQVIDFARLVEERAIMKTVKMAVELIKQYEKGLITLAGQGNNIRELLELKLTPERVMGEK